MKHGYLLYTGYGKTKLVLDKILAVPHKPRTLLISTKNVVESSWIEQINEWYPGQISYDYITGSIKEKDRLNIINKLTDILAMNTSMLNWYISHTCTIKRKAKLKNGEIKIYYNDHEILSRFDLLIIDESSLFKNSQSERFKLIKKWAHKIKHVIILSATPTPKNIEDLWAQIYLLDGGQRLGKNITAFRNKWGIPVPLPNGHNKYQYSQEAIDEILNLVRDITTSIPKPDKPLFPEPILTKGMITPDASTAALLKEFKRDYITRLDSTKMLVAFSVNQLITKVNQIASGDVYYKKNVFPLNDLKMKVLKKRLSLQTTPVMIMYTYKFDKVKLLELPGARLLSKPQDFKDWNNNLIPIGILSPFSAAHGLNLQHSDCREMIWFSPIWDTEKWIQTNARVCRRGQKYIINILVLIMRGSYDDYAFNLCIDKFKIQYNNLEFLR
jgi:hypothetical protein